MSLDKPTKIEIQAARKLITNGLAEDWFQIGDQGLELTEKGLVKRDEFTRFALDSLFEMAVTV
jgi:hypothetical protein